MPGFREEIPVYLQQLVLFRKVGQKRDELGKNRQEFRRIHDVATAAVVLAGGNAPRPEFCGELAEFPEASVFHRAADKTDESGAALLHVPWRDVYGGLQVRIHSTSFTRFVHLRNDS